MVDLWRDFAPGPNPPDEVHVVIELTRGSRNKYEYDVRARDGDPLDAVLLINEPTFTGCVALARPVANIKMVDEGAPDDKIVTVSTTDPFYRHVRSLEDIPDSLVKELTYFFENYKRAEGKATKVERWDDVDEAKKIITWAQEYYNEHERA